MVYHIEGDLAIIGDDQIRVICDKVAPVIKEAPDLFKVIVGPVPRFVYQPCCDNEEHVANRTKDDFVDNMLRGIANIKNIGRRQIHNNGILKSQTINVAPILKDHMTVESHEQDGETDKQEPTHRGYEILLKEIEDVADGLRTTAALAAAGFSKESPRPRQQGRPAAEIAPADIELPPQMLKAGRSDTRGGRAPPADRAGRASRPAPSPSPPTPRRDRRRSGSRAAENRISPYARPLPQTSGSRPIPLAYPSDTGSSGSSGGTMQGISFSRPEHNWDARYRLPDNDGRMPPPPSSRDHSVDRRRHASEGSALQHRYQQTYEPHQRVPLPSQQHQYQQYQYEDQRHRPPPPQQYQPSQDEQQRHQHPPMGRGQREPYDRNPGGIWVVDQESRYNDYGYDFHYPRYSGE